MLSYLNNINKNLRNNKKNNKKKKEDKFTFVEFMLSLIFAIIILNFGIFIWLEEGKKEEIKILKHKIYKTEFVKIKNLTSF